MDKMVDFNRILVLAPHTDDGELGCGGSLARFLEEGKTVFYAAFSTCEESVPAPFPPDILEKELYSATAELGIPAENLIVFKFKVRTLSYHRQEILDEMIRLRKEIDPNLVLMPSTSDLHQDHNTVAMEAQRAFKERTLFGYELPWNHVSFSTSAFVSFEERHLLAKERALARYESQQHRGYVQPDFTRGLARVRGQQIGSSFAEAYEVVRLIL